MSLVLTDNIYAKNKIFTEISICRIPNTSHSTISENNLHLLEEKCTV